MNAEKVRQGAIPVGRRSPMRSCNCRLVTNSRVRLLAASRCSPIIPIWWGGYYRCHQTCKQSGFGHRSYRRLQASSVILGFGLKITKARTSRSVSPISGNCRPFLAKPMQQFRPMPAGANLKGSPVAGASLRATARPCRPTTKHQFVRHHWGRHRGKAGLRRNYVDSQGDVLGNHCAG